MRINKLNRAVKCLQATALGACALTAVTNTSAADAASFTEFESAHVRPIALSPDAKWLFAINTPDNRLEIYSVGDPGLTLIGEVPVGLEPVAVAVRSIDGGRQLQAWVVNQLSDSISIVSFNPATPALAVVQRTLLVGDEPRDIVFAGRSGGRAFITTAHRGQNRPGNPQLTTPSVPRADVWVFDTNYPGAPLGGTPITILSLFSDTPRALAVSADGSTVYAAAFLSGNQTTTIAEPIVSKNGGLPPFTNYPPSDPPDPAIIDSAPETGLIVKFKNGLWLDELMRDWSTHVPFSLPDYDVFRIDADAPTPRQTGAISGVGTVLYNMAVRPDNGKLYVSNTEAFNDTRFSSVLQGHFADNRLTIIDRTQILQAETINPQIDYATSPGSPQEIAESLALPTAMVFSPDGSRLYLAAFGSSKVGVFDSDAAESGQVQRSLIPVGEGPSGLALDVARDRLYVMNRIDHSLSVISNISTPAQATELQRLKLPYNPEPPVVQQGRHFLYDASISSAHGDLACATCHVFGDSDGLAWDLGNPYGEITQNPNPKNPVAIIGIPLGKPLMPFHPMKGPMVTQSLRGLDGTGPMHWRGDKTAGLTPDGQIDPNGNPMDSEVDFERFNAAFVELQGLPAQISDSDMQTFADFMLTVNYPPNPVHALDNVSTPAEHAGQYLFTHNDLIPGGAPCSSCHALPLTTSGNTAKTAQVSPTQDEFKVPQIRNLYTKIGMFGAAAGAITGQPPERVGPQVRGFGFTHDGSISTIDMFLQDPQSIFTNSPDPGGANAEDKRRNLEQYFLGIDTGLRPIVGQQLTLTPESWFDNEVRARLHLLLARTAAGDCDLVVKGNWNGEARGALFVVGRHAFITDRVADGDVGVAKLEGYALVPGQALTFTAVPPGNGTRIAIDRDLDGACDRDELDAGTNPADPTSYPPPPQLARRGG